MPEPGETPELQSMTQCQFLETVPPGTRIFVTDLDTWPDGLRTFALSFAKDGEKWVAFKYGENPSLGPPTSSRVSKLIGEDRSEFFKGRRYEAQGLGVGPCAYHRRVVESQKGKILDEIIRVSRHVHPDEQPIADLKRAKGETRFTKAVEAIKHAIPPTLLVNGHNPLLLLHSALSEGVHVLSDKQCLELAPSIRVVLFELADRLAQAMKDEAELSAAVSRLLSKSAE